MGIVSGVVVFVIVWWTVLFAVLPWGVRRQADPVNGSDAGAPENPMLLKKALWTTGITCVIWVGVYAVVASDLVSFRAMVADWG